MISFNKRLALSTQATAVIRTFRPRYRSITEVFNDPITAVNTADLALLPYRGLPTLLYLNLTPS
jgi:hypothetical protein